MIVITTQCFYPKIGGIESLMTGMAEAMAKTGKEVLVLADGINETSDQNPEVNNYIYEPSEELVLKELIPKSLKIQLLKSIKDSIASEHGARMTAMHKATDNATELRDQLKLSYNKARQAAITNEILEIVGGAEALKG